MSTILTLTDLTTQYDLGADGTLTIGGIELGGFKSGNLSFSADTIDNSTRSDGGWQSAAAGTRVATLEVTFNKMKSDSCQNGLREWLMLDEFQTKGAEITFVSSSTAGGGFNGVFCMTGYTENQGYDGTAVECTATFQSFGPITADGAGSGSGSGS